MRPRAYVSAFVLLAVAPLAAAAPAAADPQGTAQPIASVESNWSGVAIDLVTVERKGSVLTVKWAARNHGGEQQQVQFGLVGKQVTTYLVDEESGTKYYVLTDQEKNSLASAHVYIGSDTHGISDYVPAGESRRYWAKFPAPPTEVKSLTVFISNAEPFEEVPIADR